MNKHTSYLLKHARVQVKFTILSIICAAFYQHITLNGGKAHVLASPNGTRQIDASSSSTESEDHHWKRQKRKMQDLGDDDPGLDFLDSLIIDDEAFVDEKLESATLLELEGLDLPELCGDELGNDIIAEFTASLKGSDVTAKGSRSPLNDVALLPELVRHGRSSPASTVDKEPVQQTMANTIGVSTNQPMHSRTSKPLLSPSQPQASTFDPQETILRFKSVFVSEMWGALCEWITRFSMDSTDSYEKLRSSITSTLEEIRKANIIDVSILEELVEDFFEACREHYALRSSKMTKESHQEAIADAQRRLNDAKQKHESLDGSIVKLRASLEHVERNLAILTEKRNKIIASLGKHQEKSSLNLEDIAIKEGEIYTIEANRTFFDDEVERLSKLAEAVETSRAQITGFTLFS